MAGANAQDDNLHDQEQQQNLDQQQQNQPAPNDADDLAAQLGLAPAKPGDLDHARLLEAIAERGVLREVALGADHGLGIACQRLIALAQLPSQANDRAVGLELGKR